MIACIQIKCFMPYFALIIMYDHVKIACYQCQCKPSGTSPPYSLPLVVMSGQEEIRSSGDCVDTARGQTLERLKNSFK